MCHCRHRALLPDRGHPAQHRWNVHAHRTACTHAHHSQRQPAGVTHPCHGILLICLTLETKTAQNVKTRIHKMKDGQPSVCSYVKRENRRPQRRGQVVDTWDGLVMKQPFMPQRTKPVLLTLLLPRFKRISLCQQVCVCFSPTFLRLCVTHTVTVLVYIHIYHLIFMPIP